MNAYSLSTSASLPFSPITALPRTGKIDDLVAKLPEIYQPIYGHPELSNHASRTCEDRLVSVLAVYKALEAKLGRPLRVLDLGCAQGYFSLNLAAEGALVHGVDLLASNISVCNALAAEHPDYRVQFEQNLVENVAISLEPGRYDLVLGLSVFHHLVRRYGVTLVQKMLGELAGKTTMAIFEMALSCEPVSWAASQPQNARDLMADYAFVHEFARHPHHLSAIWRPLYVASNHFWFLNGQIEAFHSWKAGSHTHASKNNYKTRRYFFGEGRIMKLYALDNEDTRAVNLQEQMSEIAFLTNPPAGFEVPRLDFYGRHQNETWMVRECMAGELLFDKITRKKPYDVDAVIKGTLEHLVALEAVGLYHNDLRTANVLITPDGGARLIDYGAIAAEKKDRRWPSDLFLSFMIYMHEVVEGSTSALNAVRASAFNPDNFPEPYRTALWAFYGRAPDEWSFAFLRDCLLHRPKDSQPPSRAMRLSFSAVIAAMESACKVYQNAAIQLAFQQKDAAATATSAPL